MYRRLLGPVFILLLTLILVAGCSSRGEGEVSEELLSAAGEEVLAAGQLPPAEGGGDAAPEGPPENVPPDPAPGQGPPEKTPGEAPAAGGEGRAPADTPATGPEVGLTAPDFTLPDPAGQSHSLSDFRGRVVVMTFWNSGCPYCLWELSYLNSLQREGEGEVVVLAVNIGDDAETVAGLWTQEGYETLPLLDDGTVAAGYLVWPIPDNLIIDPQGVITFRSPGLMHLEDLREAVAAARE